VRKGLNPHKDKPYQKSEYTHQIIIPVYIPHKKGYFADSFQIFKVCLQSLFHTIHSKTFVSIVNNGSCLEVKKYIDTLFTEKKVQEVIHTENIGKLNSIVKGLTGNTIELVTISDADVLFLPNWQQETVHLFNVFPKAGVVGIVPQFRNFSHLCGNIIFENFFSKKMKFTPVKNRSALLKFFNSLGWEENIHYSKAHLNWNLAIERNNTIAVVGSGHFVTTYRKDLFTEVKTYFGYKLGADTERYLDEMPLKKGMWRLTTQDNYAYHLGNVYEDWMGSHTTENSYQEFNDETLLPLDAIGTCTTLNYFLKNKVFIFLFNKLFFRKFFYQMKGLPKEAIHHY
jgi:hypothetical protein